jgi:RNA-directed DNA polymerase
MADATRSDLTFNEDKTHVVTLEEGFDFLGFNVRRYGATPLIKPSSAAIRRIRERLRAEMRSLRGVNVSAVIKRLNPIIRGWAAYYRTQVSSDTFNALDNYLWKLTYKWARLSHPNKSRRWVISRYFDRFDQSRQDRWGFGNRHRGCYLHKFAWTTIVRHQVVPGVASLDDPSLTEYWTRRRRKATLPINNTALSGSTGPRMVAARSAPERSTPSRTSRSSRSNGNTGWQPPAP